MERKTHKRWITVVRRSPYDCRTRSRVIELKVGQPGSAMARSNSCNAGLARKFQNKMRRNQVAANLHAVGLVCLFFTSVECQS